MNHGLTFSFSYLFRLYSYFPRLKIFFFLESAMKCDHMNCLHIYCSCVLYCCKNSKGPIYWLHRYISYKLTHIYIDILYILVIMVWGTVHTRCYCIFFHQPPDYFIVWYTGYIYCIHEWFFSVFFFHLMFSPSPIRLIN